MIPVVVVVVVVVVVASEAERTAVIAVRSLMFEVVVVVANM
jgi:hypothetical protein